MAFLWNYLYSRNLGPEPAPVARVPLTPIVPDRSPEFETVEDKTEIRLRDMAAYKKLLDQVAAQSPAALRQQSRRDVLSIQIWVHPEHYRGLPLQILGTLPRVFTSDTKLSRTGRPYDPRFVTSRCHGNACV